MPWNGSGEMSLETPTASARPAGGLLNALENLRMRIPRSPRSARARRRPVYAGTWVLVSPTK